MPSTSTIGWTCSFIAILLNGLALLQFMGQINLAASLVPAVLVFNMIALPIATWGAYRLGEMAEVQHVKDEVRKAAEKPQSGREKDPGKTS
ncbi:MAG: hypothetical protein ACR2PG_24000 [Hyphomicrobiaceae bacterium]